MTDQEELLKEYYNETFIFKHLYKNRVKYEKQYKNKTVIVEVFIDNRSDLNLHETLSSLDCEAVIDEITVI